jgi:(p)ppGpp synthase/HD superfamily hydrolase
MSLQDRQACYSERMSDAMGLVTQAFRHTRRKGTSIPYLSHLMQVAVWVAERGGSEDQILAGLLHDYIEDIDGATEEEVAERFGANVGQLVAALSDSTGFPKPPWKERKLAYLAHLQDERPEVKLVSACDKLHNASCILRDLRSEGEILWDRFSASKEDTLWYYREVVSALGTGWDNEVVGELQAVVDLIHQEALA